MWYQTTINLPAKQRGCHPITSEIRTTASDIKSIKIGLLHLFLQHTSASITINENADPDVPADLEMAASTIAHDRLPYTHTCEGPDDMPAHLKTAMFGHQLTIPIKNGELQLGTWQGIFLWEHRDHASARRVVATIQGEPI